MIRPALFKALIDALGSHPYLAVEDFSVSEYENRDKEPCFSIKYRYNPAFYLNCRIPNMKRRLEGVIGEHYFFQATMNPGREAAVESLAAEDRQGIVGEIREWLKRLHEDLVSVPIVRQFDAQSSAIEQLRERLDQLPDEPLSHQDVVQFQDALNRVKIELDAQLKQQTADKEELQRRVEELGRDIDFLKQTLESMTKRQWGQAFFVRVRKWKDRLSLRQLAAGTRVMKVLLPEHLADELDAVANAADGIADVVEGKQPTGESR